MMNRHSTYSGALTAEHFLFYEMRITAGFYLEAVSLEQAAAEIKAQNLFQYPTEREIKRLTKACYRRLEVLNSRDLVTELKDAPMDIAKHINLYAMMRDNRLVCDFMVQLIGEKYSTRDLSLAAKDINGFFAGLQAQNDQIASWSNSTISKIKSVLKRALVETEYIDSTRATKLNSILISPELEDGIRRNGDTAALAAFNCFR